MKTLYRSVIPAVVAAWLTAGPAAAVTSKIDRFSEASELLKGETKQTVVDSQGTIRLSRQADAVDCGDLLDGVWTINSMVAAEDGTVYLGTSPNGTILKVKGGDVEVVRQAVEPKAQEASEESDDQDEANEKKDALFANEHIFALALDEAGRLLAGISGDKAVLVRIEDGEAKTLYEPEDAKYILSIALDDDGNIFLGTGPNGHIYTLNAAGAQAEKIYSAKDKNILSLAVGPDGMLYAGSDERGLIYKIDPEEKTASAMYDAEQPEITSLLFGPNGDLYAAASNAQVVEEKVNYDPVAADESAGKPDSKSGGNDGKSASSTDLKIPKTDSSKQTRSNGPRTQRGTLPKTAGHIYRITPEGYVTDLFTDLSVFFAMGLDEGRLLLGTGNKAQLYAVDVQTEQKHLAFEDEQASQITAMALTDDGMLLGLSNPAKLVRLSERYNEEGTYVSDLIDAGQPSRWGKLQIDARMPKGCEVWLSSRSGNVKDADDPTFSEWTEAVRLSEPTDLGCPVGRFCQYRLTLKTDDGSKTPVVNEVAVAHVAPNLAPAVESIDTEPHKNKAGVLQVSYKAEDDNKDTLVYTVEFRRQGRSGWIQLKDDLTDNSFEWDTRTVEDGRYELRVTADDVRGNSDRTALQGTRVSDAVVVDNTAPRPVGARVRVNGDVATVRLTLEDELSVIDSLSYTVDSNDDWSSALPEDLVYDTMTEQFEIRIDDLESGRHVIALRFKDQAGNTGYKTLEAEVK